MDFMHAMSVINAEQRKCIQLTVWMDFMPAMSVIEIKERRPTRLTTCVGFHPGNISDQNRAEAHSDSPPGWHFMKGMSVIEVKERRRTAIHRLNCGAYQ
jgi:hypothetical protein